MDNLTYHLTLTLTAGEKAFGPGPMRLLEGVQATGSLRQSAAGMGMAYSKAWTVVRRLEALWGFALLTRRSGGADGGGSRLTPEGEDILTRYKAMAAEVEQAAEKAFAAHFRDL